MRHATVKCTSVGGSHGKFVDEKPRCRHTSFHHGRAWLVGGDTTKAYELLRTRTYRSSRLRQPCRPKSKSRPALAAGALPRRNAATARPRCCWLAERHLRRGSTSSSRHEHRTPDGAASRRRGPAKAAPPHRQHARPIGPRTRSAASPTAATSRKLSTARRRVAWTGAPGLVY